jgi:hypothetical protein
LAGRLTFDFDPTVQNRITADERVIWGKRNSMARSKIDPRLRAEFKEIARSIIALDRQAKKLGRSQNTIGDIERALVGAFVFGQELGDAPYTVPKAEDAGTDWEEVPPRGRDVLTNLTYRSDQYKVTTAIGLRRVPGGGKARWGSQYESGYALDHTVADGSVSPLVRIGLLAPSEGDEELLVLTAKGQATCDAYWRRLQERDPNLPKGNIRA